MLVVRDPAPPDFYRVLWLGALLHATGVAIDVLPPEFGELGEQFFRRYRPIAQA